MKVVLAQINTIVGDITGNQEKILQFTRNAEDIGGDIVIFPELSITGYPVEDLLLHSKFIRDANNALNQIITESKNFNAAIIVGCPFEEDHQLYNTAFFIYQGEIITKAYKRKLPNYNVFDEKRYFAAGNEINICEFKNKKIILSICEDIWERPDTYKKYQDEVDFVVSINASPYEHNKYMQRLHIAQEFVDNIKVPLVYVNLVGGQDDLIFDGGSFVINEHKNLVEQSPFWCESLSAIDIKEQLDKEMEVKTPNNLEFTYNALLLATRDYVKKNNFSKVILGLSGGIDSTLVATLACDALGTENVICVKLPTKFSSESSHIDANELCEKLGCQIIELNIEDLRNKTISLLKNYINVLTSLTAENIQARLRMLLLMALSSENNALLLNTSNKSETAVGYTTIYGDMSGGFAPLIDVYKTEIYELAGWRNEFVPEASDIETTNFIPLNIFVKSPSAELKPNQKDEDSLPAYEILDPILKSLIDERLSPQELINNGKSKETVTQIYQLIKNSEFKRYQAPPGPKISKMNFGKGRRMPITNAYNG